MTATKTYGLLAGGVLLLVAALFVGAAAAYAVDQSNQSNSNGSGDANTGAPGYGYGGMMGGGPMGASLGAGGIMGGAAATQTNPTAQRLSGDQVRKAVVGYIDAYYKGQNLTIAAIVDFQNNFYAQVKEQATAINAFELLIDPYSGNVWPEYGPNIMWNTKYGQMGVGSGVTLGSDMMGGSMQANEPTTDMPVKAEQATHDAQQYLQAQGSTLTVARQLDTFYGYYTLYTLQDGKIEGLLSVNGYTGQVWYHSGHGPFLGMVGSGD